MTPGARPPRRTSEDEWAAWPLRPPVHGRQGARDAGKHGGEVHGRLPVAAWKAWSAGIWRTMKNETPVWRYAQPPTPRASNRPAVSRSARPARAIQPSSSAAAAQTATNTSSGTADLPGQLVERKRVRDGRARQLGVRLDHVHPAALRRGRPRTRPSRDAMPRRQLARGCSHRAAAASTSATPSLAREPSCDRRGARVRCDGRALAQRECEASFSWHERVVASGVEPDVGVRAAEARRYGAEPLERRVPRDSRRAPPEDRVVMRRLLIAGPALDEAELPGCWMAMLIAP